MKEIDATIDSKPTQSKVRQLAELRIQNLDCFRELKAYNDTGKFLYKHSLIRNFSLRAELEDKLRKDPAAFLDDYTNVKGNVTRYTSFVKSNKRTTKQKEKDQQSLQKHTEMADLYKSVLENR